MKSRKLGIALLLLLSLVVTTGTFAYWASSVTEATDQTSNQSVTLGTGSPVTLTLSATAGTGNGATGLVPVGFGTPNTVTFVFDVSWAEDVTGATGYTTANLTVTTDNEIIKDGAASTGATQAEILSMFTFSDNAPATLTLDAAAETITITVEFTNAPADATLYGKTAGFDLTFDVTFSVTPVVS